MWTGRSGPRGGAPGVGGGRQGAGVTDYGFRVPDKLTALTEEKLAEVRGWIEAAGLLMRDGILAADAEMLEGGLGWHARPAGADNSLRWRRTIDEHLELRRINWHEYAMFSWLCTKADPRTGCVRTSWPVLAEQTGLTPRHVEKLCRSLRRKGYVAYPIHQGKRRVLVELAINKFPLV